MRAAVMRDRQLVVADVPAPEPGPGEVLVRTLACGICGSDLHALKHAEQFVETARRAGNAFVMDLARDVVMGHEFCAEIVDHGPDTTRALPAGTRVCSRPALMRADRAADHRLLERQPRRLRRVHAAHRGAAARGARRARRPSTPRSPSRWPSASTRSSKARLEPDDAPLVIGCGPVGLAVIAALRLRGVRPDRRRRLLAAAARAGRGARRRRRRRSRRDARPGRAGARRPCGAIRAARPRCRRGCRARPCAPPSSSSASACPACSTRSWRRRRAARASWWSACAWRPTRSTRCSASARS